MVSSMSSQQKQAKETSLASIFNGEPGALKLFLIGRAVPRACTLTELGKAGASTKKQHPPSCFLGRLLFWGGFFGCIWVLLGIVPFLGFLDSFSEMTFALLRWPVRVAVLNRLQAVLNKSPPFKGGFQQELVQEMNFSLVN